MSVVPISPLAANLQRPVPDSWVQYLHPKDAQSLAFGLKYALDMDNAAPPYKRVPAYLSQWWNHVSLLLSMGNIPKGKKDQNVGAWIKTISVEDAQKLGYALKYALDRNDEVEPQLVPFALSNRWLQLAVILSMKQS
ncbi:MAG: hypothetical protein AAFR61_15245 [Bacteroidota bacterium]